MIRSVTDSVASFFGREDALAALRAELDAVTGQARGRMLSLRGRRQVGKSATVEQFVERADVPSVFATAVFGASAAQQLADVTNAITEARIRLPNSDVLAQEPARSWRDWLGRIALAARSGPVIMVLDEFPWFAAADPTLEGELQVQWDRVLEKLPVLAILIGSDLAVMDRLASHGRPLFGRLRPIVLPALNPAEVAQALPAAAPVEAIDAYLITGGYPRLVTDLSASGVPPVQFARESLADPLSPLATTARLTLAAEFPDGPSAYQVLSAIGADDTARPGFSQILGAIANPDERQRTETAITRALQTLTGAKRLIERERPAWAAPSSRLRRYRITDPYLRFWFRYVERQADRVARGRADLAVAAFDRDWPSWRGRTVVPLVRQSLLGLAQSRDQLSGVEEVAAWWVRDGSVEVDVAALTATATVVVGTVKWRQAGGVTSHDLARLRAARARVPRAQDAKLAAISPSGRAPKGADLAFSAADLLDAWRVPG
jgi:AAA+ ATPase superfamily predicted ATPase